MGRARPEPDRRLLPRWPLDEAIVMRQGRAALESRTEEEGRKGQGGRGNQGAGIREGRKPASWKVDGDGTGAGDGRDARDDGKHEEAEGFVESCGATNSLKQRTGHQGGKRYPVVFAAWRLPRAS